MDTVEIPDPGAAVDEVDTAAVARAEKELVDRLVEELAWYKKLRASNYDDLFEECYRVYRTQRPNEAKSGEWRSKIHVPLSWTNVEELLPHLMAGIFTSENLVRVADDVHPKMAEAQQIIVRQQLNQQMSFEDKVEEHQKQKLIYGSSPTYLGFKIQKELRKMWDKAQGLAGAQLQVMEKEIYTYIGNFLEVIDIREMYVHPHSTPDNIIKQARVYYRPKDWMERAGFKNLDKVLPELKQDSKEITALGDERKDRFGAANVEQELRGRDDYKVVTFWDERAKMIYSYVEDKILVQEEAYPYWHGQSPILWDRHIILPKEFYGVGAVEPTISLQHEANARRNQRADAISLAINPVMVVRDGAVEDEQTDLISRPGQVIHTQGGPADIEFLHPPKLPLDSDNESAELNIEIQRAVGSSPAMGGQPVLDSGKGNQVMQRVMVLRLQQSIRRTAHWVQNVVFQMVSNNCQFYPLEEVKEHFKPMLATVFQDYAPEQLMVPKTIRIEPAAIYADDAVLFQQMTNWTNVWMQNPAVAMEINWKYLAKQSAKKMGLDAEEIFTPEGQAFPALDIVFASEENWVLNMGQELGPAQPGENHDAHMQVHKIGLENNPAMFLGYGQHMMSHDQAKQQRMMMLQAAQLGGAPGGGLNPARQPQATDDLGMKRQQASGAPSVGK